MSAASAALRICRFQRIAVNYPKYTIEYPCLARTFSKLFVKKCYGIRSGRIAWLPFRRIKAARLFAPWRYTWQRAVLQDAANQQNVSSHHLLHGMFGILLANSRWACY